MDKDRDDFDPTRILDGWTPAGRATPAAAPDLDLSGLLGGLRAESGPRREAALDPERLARLKKRGFEMRDVEDVEVPEIRIPPVPAPQPVDDAGLAQAVQSASAVAKEQQQVPADGPEAGLDLARLHETPRPRVPDPRLLAHWQPGAWIAVRRRAAGASTELLNTADGPLLENRPPQWLLAAWPPQELSAPLLGRWPETALLVGAEQAGEAAEALLRAVPAPAPLWVAELDADWALLADLVLHHDTALQPFQIKALRTLAEAERLAAFERLNSAYAPAADGRPLRLRR